MTSAKPLKRGISTVAAIKLFSWNVNGLRAVLRKGALQQFLQDQKPDILCLQEIKCRPDQLDLFEADALKDYEIFWNPADRPGYSGTATLVRKGVASCSRISPNPQEPVILSEGFASSSTMRRDSPVYVREHAQNPNAKSRATRTRTNPERGVTEPSARPQALEAVQNEGRVLTLDFGDFYLINVYTPNSKPDLSRLSLRHDDWDPAFKNYLKELEKQKPIITCGDFNCAHEEIDLARPKTNHHSAGFTDEERTGLTNLLNAGFLDTFREKHPAEQRYTWWSHWGKARENNVGWRIDYFFISKSLAKNLVAADIHEAYLGSDHCPISITMEIN